jgi:CheY-like chemotaxis protein
VRNRNGDSRPLRVAFFPDVYHEVDGVANTSRHFEAFAQTRELPFLTIHAGPRTEEITAGSVTRIQLRRSRLTFPLDQTHEFDLALWRRYRDVVRWVRDFDPDIVQITGPSDLGMLGALIAHKLRVPLAATWQTNVHEYARCRLALPLSFLPVRISAKSLSAVEHLCFRVLCDEGYEVAIAVDGFDALLQLQRRAPALILSDLNMPQMSGFELLSVVRRRFPDILVVASSGAYDSSAVPNGVIADAFYAKGQEDAPRLLEIIASLIRTGSLGHKNDNAPVWIPRNGMGQDGKPFVVLTCTQCLRSFPFAVDHEPTGEVLRTPCIYCPHEVTYIIDFSRSVNSPEKRAAWKASFLKSQDRSS